jgi:xanthine dehydrogenase/oxidase
MLVAEDIICKVADYLGLCVDDVRRTNLLKPGDRLPFGTDDKQILTKEHIIEAVMDKCDSTFQIKKRREKIAKFNEENKWKKRGVALGKSKTLLYLFETYRKHFRFFRKIMENQKIKVAH